MLWPTTISFLASLSFLPLSVSDAYGFTFTRTRTPRMMSTRLHMSTVDTTAAESASSVGGATTVVSVSDLTKSWTGTPQFEGISLKIGKGQRLGLIGVNGAGKSTLMKCIGRVDKPDSGSIETASNCNVIYVDQEPKWTGMAVYEALFEGDSAVSKTLRTYYKVMNPDIELDSDQFMAASELMEENQGWEYQDLALDITKKLNIPEAYLYRDVDTLSGGERKRVGLSSALLKQPDVLLLDEPTNHLDADALDWLADYLRPGGKDKEMAMLLVTHDRFFLERTCSEIIELDRANLYRYPGNYQKYLELKAERLNAEDADSARAKTKLRREAEWMAKQPQGRQRKSKARQDQFYELVDKAKAREVATKVEFNSDEEKKAQKRLGGVVSEFRKAKYVMGDRVLLEDFTYDFKTTDRIGIVGPNGVGKSTFLKVLTGQLALDSGSVRVGDTVRVGHYEQTGLKLTAEQEAMPVLKFVMEAVDRGASQVMSQEAGNAKQTDTKMVVQEVQAKGRRNVLAGKGSSNNIQILEGSGLKQAVAVAEADARKLLTRFQFSSARWYDRVGQLSGGERRRLQLLQVLALQPNLLLLDEPSNDLDLLTLSALEDYLTETYKGCLVVVSHDNFFVNAVAEHLFVFEGDGVVRDFQGTYTEYLEYRQYKAQEALEKKKEDTKVAKLEIKEEKEEKKKEEKRKEDNLSFAERKEMMKLEKEIQKIGVKMAEEQQKIDSASPDQGYSVLAEMVANVQKLQGQIDEKEVRWLELSEKDE